MWKGSWGFSLSRFTRTCSSQWAARYSYEGLIISTPIDSSLQALGNRVVARSGVSCAPAGANSLLQGQVCNQDQHTWAGLWVWGWSPAHLDAGAGLRVGPSTPRRRCGEGGGAQHNWTQVRGGGGAQPASSGVSPPRLRRCVPA